LASPVASMRPIVEAIKAAKAADLHNVVDSIIYIVTKSTTLFFKLYHKAPKNSKANNSY
jgi:hypothetical protein